MAAEERTVSLEWVADSLSSAKFDLASTGTANISVVDLANTSENKRISDGRLSLNTISLQEHGHGSANKELRENLASLYSARSGGVTAEDILITSGGSTTDYAVLSALLSRGDHVICQYPIEELLLETLASLGIEVSRWTAEPTKKWRLDVEELQNVVKKETKMIIIQSPCDPSGGVVPRPTLETLAEIAQAKGIPILANEMYRPLFHSISPSDDDFPPSAINLGYKRVVVTGSVSKAYSLGGVRVGWIGTKDRDIITACRRLSLLRSSIASKLDEVVAAEAISDRCIHALLSRNISLCRTNLTLLQEFIEEHSWACSWVKPQAGTTALLKFHKMGKPVDSEGFCSRLLKDSGVLLHPLGRGSDTNQALRGYVRVAFGGSTEDVKAALAAWKTFMEEQFEAVPTSQSSKSNHG